VIDTEAKSEPVINRTKIQDRPNGSTKSLDLDDLADFADKFLSVLGVEDSPFSFSSHIQMEPKRVSLKRIPKGSRCEWLFVIWF